MIKVLQENDKVLIFSNLVVFIRANESVIVLVCNCVYFEGVVFVFCFKGEKVSWVMFVMCLSTFYLYVRVCKFLFFGCRN